MTDFTSVASGGNISFKVNSGSQVDSGLSGCIWYDGSTCTNTNPSPVTSSSDEETVTITVSGGSSGGSDSTNSITVHAQYPYIYVWDSGTSIDKTAQAMTSEGTNSDWYYYTISATSASIIFEDDASWTNKTSDLSISEAGEYWYYSGSFYDYNPEDTVAPELVSFSASSTGKVTGSVTFTVSATDDKNLSKAVLTMNGSTLATISLSGTSDTGTYTWDTSYVQNDSYTIGCIVYDTAKNKDTAASIELTTENENLPPVAVISGSKKPTCGASITYKATSSYDQNGGTIASWDWTLSGSGATISSGASSDTLVVSTSSTEGATFTLTLVVTDNDGAESDAVSISCETVAVDANWDFRDETIYFLMTTRFYDGNTGNNVYCWDEGGEYLKYGTGDCAWRGDFQGLIDKLDYIKALGFTSIWITPVVVNASGIDYHGYHAFDFSHVDPRYGSGTAKYDVNGDDISGDEAYQDLIDAVHDKGMKIIQDIVLNHTGNWGEKNLYPMFTKGEEYTDDDGYKRSAPMVANEDFENLKNAESVLGYSTYAAAEAASQEYAVRLRCLKGDDVDTGSIYHHEGSCEYSGISQQMGSMAGDCVDLNTENPTVQKYLIDSYNKYIDMGIDAFRIDTVKHISRLIFNEVFNPAFLERASENGNDKFYMFGEVCARYRGRWNEQLSQVSPSFYTWAEDNASAYDLSSGWTVAEINTQNTPVYQHWANYATSLWESILASIQPSISNCRLNGNAYHEPDTSMASGLNVIDFPMHWAFNSASDAFGVATSYDTDYNDATWNVTYVDSHDYAPDNAPENQRFNGTWPDKLNLMFTFRGIPCIYYGSEIEFMKGCAIDPANTRTSLDNSGRAYYGDNLEGTVTASDFGEYTASGTVATTLSHDLAQHIIRLNKIRAAIPALRKGQYSTDGCSGTIAFKRRYTKDGTDSFALVAINGGATFTGIPSGTYVEVITGNTVTSTGSLTTDSIGENNMRVYVLQTNDGVEPSGKIGSDGAYLN